MEAPVTSEGSVRAAWCAHITGVVFHAPADTKLDWEYLLRALSRAFGYEGWVQVHGPDSMALR